MNYEEARVYLDNAAKYGSVLGLDNMKEMLARLDNPQDELKFIHISGTNGKGSVLAYLSTVLKEAGYRVGRYISPTLFRYRERIQVNEAFIEKDSLAAHVAKIKAVADAMEEEGLPHPTSFEIETALSFLYFKEKKCDIVVLETGLGGLDDATNVITTTVMEVIASISMDHMGILGETIAEIAAKKAGIIKPDTLVVTMQQKKEAMQVVLDTAKEKNCQVMIASPKSAKDIHYGYEEQSFSYGGYDNLKISLAGSYQVANAVLAVEAVNGLIQLGYRITPEVLRSAFAHTRWPGRFTLIRREPVFIIDGAHNRDAAQVLKESIELYFPDKKIYYIMGVFKDKEYREILKTTAPYAEAIITIETPHNDRALPALELAAAASEYHKHVEAADSIKDALKKSLSMAGKDDVIIAFGSLSFLGEITREMGESEDLR